MQGLPPEPLIAEPTLLRKICPRSDLRDRLASVPRPLVFTNGVFDILHAGHVTYLDQARGLGATLVVALNTDASVRRLGKGPERPLNGQYERAIVIAALESVSLVTWFEEDTPVAIVREIHPDVLVKGGDYDMDQLEEAAWVRAYGGAALSIPFVPGHSTTNLVRRIRSQD